MSNATLALTPELRDYLLQHSLRESPLLSDLREQTRLQTPHEMQIAPEQGQFMRLIVRLINASKALEIGTFTGYSAICIAQGLAQHGKLITCDTSEAWTAIARDYWHKADLAEKIDLRLAPALETLAALQADHCASFDFIFIDADKQNYCHYYQESFRLLRNGGLMMIDNVLWGGEVIDANNHNASTRAIRALNTMVLEDSRVEISMVPIGDGLTLVHKL